MNELVALLKEMTSLPSTHHMHKHSLQYTHGVMVMRQSALLLLATLVCIINVVCPDLPARSVRLSVWWCACGGTKQSICLLAYRR